MAGDSRTSSSSSLQRYRAKRDFTSTREPSDAGVPSASQPRFVIQKHWARRLHYDFRLELDGTLKSWAVPKGPSLDPGDKRMAVQVEDHPLTYADFEGEIGEGNYGAGRVIVWDRGRWSARGDPLQGYESGKLSFELHGEKLRGGWTLVRMRARRANERQPSWLLIKENDSAARAAADYSVVDALPDSVLSGAAPPQPDAAKPRAARKKIAGSTRPASAKRLKSSKTAPPDEEFEVTHPDRVIDTASRATKLDLVRYYARVAALMLPHLERRPVALLRAPRGISGGKFFQKHAAGTQTIPGVKTIDASVDARLDAGDGALLEIANAEGLLNLAQLNTIELHTWNARSASIARPDRLSFDLDPGERVGFDRVRDAALRVRALLDALGLVAFLKTSGGKGLHLIVPIVARHDWDAALGFAKGVVEHLARIDPERFVAQSGEKNRVGKIFVDYLRNGFGATTVCAWSARARPGLGVSVPIGWDEIDAIDSGAHWTIHTLDDARLALGNAPWRDYEASRRGLGGAIGKLEGAARR